MLKVNPQKVHKILVISLSNIGDVILSFPVVDVLKTTFPDARFSIVIGSKAQDLLLQNAMFEDIIIFNKKQNLFQLSTWMECLRRKRFDFVVDLRHSMMPVFIGAKYRTPYLYKTPSLLHMKAKHLSCLGRVIDAEVDVDKKCCLALGSMELQTKILMEQIGLRSGRFCMIAPGAASVEKRWPPDKFSELTYILAEKKRQTVVLIGGQDDKDQAAFIEQKLPRHVINLCGKTNLLQSAALMQHAAFLVSNDSAPMHLASYLDIPVLGLFGPTDPAKYGPWGANGVSLRKNIKCKACRNNHKSKSWHTCMREISVETVVAKLEQYFIK